MSGVEGADALYRRFEALRQGKAERMILGQFGLLAVGYAKAKAPRKTGNLRRTIRVESVDEREQTVRVVAGGSREVGYAAMVEFGTRPHVIVPRRRKALAWGGARRLSGSLRKGASPTRFARRVRHPGTPARPYLVPGAEQALREVGLADAVVRAWDDAA